jgi:hypothetical protein
MAKLAQDPWLLNPDGSPDPFASNVDWGANYADLKDPDVVEPDNQEQFIDPALEAHENLDPEIVRTPVAGEPTAPVEPLPAPEVDQPETMSLDDGTELTIEKEKGQWKGTVSSSTGGNPQVYWGKTLKELIFNTLKAQANATKKIREQNAKLKFRETPRPVPQEQPAAPKPVSRSLTADEIFEIKTQLESDPALALDTLFQRRTGMNIDQLVELAQRGARQGEYASNQLTAETVNNTFLRNNPDYYPDDNWHNYTMVVKWLAKYKLGQSVDKVDDSVLTKLISANVYTVENLEEAFRDLIDDDLLVKAPVKKLPKTTPQVEVPPEPIPPAPRPDPRIVSQVTRPRASLGIGRNDITPVASPETPKAPSVEDLDNLSDSEINNLMAAVRKQRNLGRRSN